MVRAGDGVPEEELFRVPNGDDPARAVRARRRAARPLPRPAPFMPRFSFAWTPTGNGNMAVRGGVGLFYDRPGGQPPLRRRRQRPVNSPPYNLSSQYENGNLAAPGGGASPRWPRSGTLDAIDPDLNVPRYWNWSVSVQRELPWGLFGELGYVGSRASTCSASPTSTSPRSTTCRQPRAARRPARQHELPAPVQGLLHHPHASSDADSTTTRCSSSSASAAARCGDAQLHAGPRQRQRERRTAPTPRTTRTRTPTTAPAISTARTSWWAPGRGRCRSSSDRAGVGRVLGGWEISGIARPQSGAPLTVTANTTIGSRRADLVGDPYVGDAPTGAVSG